MIRHIPFEPVELQLEECFQDLLMDGHDRDDAITVVQEIYSEVPLSAALLWRLVSVNN